MRPVVYLSGARGALFTKRLIRVALIAAALLLVPFQASADYVYTVNWNMIPGNPTIMPQATFQFSVPSLATSNGTIPLNQITILNDPCGGISDPNPALYGVNTFSITLNCLVGGYANLWKETLYGTTANITGPGTYNFTYTNLSTFGTYGNYDINSQHFFYANFENYGGSVTVTQSQVPEPATFCILGTGLLAIGLVRRLGRKK